MSSVKRYNDRFNGILNASAEKRYRSFLNTAADGEEVWMLSGKDGYITMDIDGVIYLLVWPGKEYAVHFSGEDTPISIEVHDFVEQCEELLREPEQNIQFMVFPSQNDGYIVDSFTLMEDLLEELERLE